MSFRSFAARDRPVALTICVIVAALIVRPLLALSGPPGYRHDWIWPVVDASLGHVAEFALSAWSPQDLGVPNSYPSLAPVFLYIALIAKLFGLGASFKCFVFGCALSAAVGALFAAQRMFLTSWTAAVPAAIVYAASPGFTNQLIAGHFGDLVAFGAFPWFIAAIVMQYRKPATRHVLLCCASAAVCAVEVQFLFLGTVTLVMFAVITRSRAVIAAGIWTTAFVFAANATTIGQTLRFGTDFGIFLRERAVLSWVRSQSSPLPFALYGAGYAPHYDRNLLAAPLWFASIVASAGIVAAFVYTCVSFRRDRAVLAVSALYVAGVSILGGVRGPLGPVVGWLIVHVQAASLLRELYHASQFVAFALAIGVAGLFARFPRFGRHRILTGSIATVAIVGFALGPLSGASAKYFIAYPFANGEREILQRIVARSGADRIVIAPGQQPVAYAESVGVDPLSYFPLGDHWSVFSYMNADVTALAADLWYQGRYRDARRLYRRMSVGAIVHRADVTYALPRITLEHDAIAAPRPAAGGPEATSLERVDALALVHGNRLPVVVDGDFERLLDPREDGDTLAFMRQMPRFLHSGVPYRVGSANAVDAQIAFGCRSFDVPHPSTRDAGIRQAWVAAYRYAYADPVLAMPLAGAIATQSDQRAPIPASQTPILIASRSGAQGDAFAWRRRMPPRAETATTRAIAGIAGPLRLGCAATFHPSNDRGRVNVTRFVRASPVSLTGTLSATGPGTLAFSDAFHSGWKLSIDGRPVDDELHFIADGFANGWIVQHTRGTHSFELRYEPQRFFDRLVALQIAAWSALVVLVVTTRRRTHEHE